MIKQKFCEYFQNKKITVMGLGLNQGGTGTASFLARAGAKVLVTDLKTKKELIPSLKQLKGLPITYIFGKHRNRDFIYTDLIIQNPAVPRDSKYLKIARAHNVPIETDMGIFLMFCPSKNIIAVAGTKGKGTVSALLYHIFRAAKQKVVLAGNIGISALNVLSTIKPETIVILEISSWQLEGLEKHQFASKIAVLTNILPDHLDRYSNFRDYARAEKLIFKFQRKNDLLILNADNKLTFKSSQKVKSKIFWFSRKKKIKNGCFVENNKVVCQIGSQKNSIAKISEIPLLGEHNLENVLAASVTATVYGLSEKTLKKAIQNFKNLPYRLEFIRKLKGIWFYNDSAATTPDACLAALRSFEKPIILILGGKDKKMSFEGLIKIIAKNKKTYPAIFSKNGATKPRFNRVKKIILLIHPAYDASEKILKAVKKYKIEGQIVLAFNMKEAVRKARQEALAGDIILLSPAAASFGMFQNEFDRGKQFIKAVKNLN